MNLNTAVPINKYRGWVHAIVAIHGPMTVGYIGKVENHASDDTAVTLHDAIEVQTLMSVAVGGTQFVRSAFPIGFYEAVTTTRVRPLAMHPLDNLSELDLKAIDGLLKEAEMTRASLRPSTGQIVPPSPQAMRQVQRMNGR